MCRGFRAGVCDHGRRSDSGAVGGCVVAAAGVGSACSPVQLVSRATPSGRWWSATDRRHVGSESWLERDLMLLDFDPTVIAIGSQPFWLRWSEGSGRPVARRRHRDSAPCHAAGRRSGHRFPRTPGDYRPLLYRPAWRGQAARLRPEVMTPARLSSLRGMALQCSRTHDQDVQGLKVVGRHQPGFTAVARGAIPAPPGVGLAAPLSRRPPQP
jgi:hypothetical protein